MQRARVVDGGADLLSSQALLKRVALLCSNRVLVVDVSEPFGFERRHDSGHLL
jgi:hypothetical protein